MLAIIGISQLYAQENFVLNEIQNVSKVQDLPSDEVTYFSVNKATFNNPALKKGAKIILNTNTESKKLIVTRKTEYVPGYISLIAANAETGDRVFAGTYHEGRLSGLYHQSHKKVLSLGYDESAGKNYIRKSNHSEEFLGCNIEELRTPFGIPNRISGLQDQIRTKSANTISTSAPLNEALDDTITIDVMIVYTNAAEQWSNTSDQGDIDGVIAQAFNLSQQALDNSEIDVELRMVHAHKTSYDETTDGLEDSGDRLRRLTQDDQNPTFDESQYNGYMQQVHDLRDQNGADIVAMFARIEDTGGLGWRLGSSGGNQRLGFNLNRVQQVARTYTLIHEIGHNMGNAHARTQQEAGASEAGGLFHYSAGYQDEGAGFHTVMAYNTTKSGTELTPAPYFSSPDLTFEGSPLGTTDLTTPEDNTLSMKQIKRSVSYYRPTQVSPPNAQTSDNSIVVVMNREENVTATITLSNTSGSALVYDADFKFPDNSLVKQKMVHNKELRTTSPVEKTEYTSSPANFAWTNTKAKTSLNEEIVYATSFESGEGFAAGSFGGRNDWKAISETEFEISSLNSNTGSQHLRFNYDDGNTKFMSSPFFGYQTLGTYEVTINFELSDPSQEVYDFYINDGKTGGFSSGVILEQGSIFYADRSESGGLTFLGGIHSIQENTYNNLRIVYNVDNESIDYYLNGTQVYQAEYLEGYTPGVIEVLNRNQHAGSYIDVDDVQIKKVEAPYAWLDLPKMNGVVSAGSSEDIDLNFTSEGVSAGEYETVFTIRTNQPGNQLIEIPITLTVNDVVSNEPENLPTTIALEQNFPNPFNPTTTIKYSLQEPQTVQLEVYNLQGQKVATIQESQTVSAGEHSVAFDASALSSGIYMYRLETATQTLTKKMVLIK
jgi:hypothetical protein